MPEFRGDDGCTANMSREFKGGSIILLVFIAIGIWIARSTYWESDEVTLPMKEIAARNPNYSLAVLVRSLGGNIRHSALSGLVVPGPDALLILANISPSYAIDREVRIRNWVEHGGRAVIGADLLEEDPKLQRWSGVSTYEPLRAGKHPVKPGDDSDCSQWRNDARTESYRICAFTGAGSLLISRATQWEVRDEEGTQAVRVRIGSGSLTIIRPASAFSNLQLRRADNARLFVRAAQIHRGDAVWFVDPPESESLLRLLWRLGAPVVALLLAGVLLMLWRMTDRLGPPEIDQGSARRSLREQIAGNASFAWRMKDLRGLFGAQRRALSEAAARRIRHYRTMNWHDQASAVAALGGVDAKSLELAIMDTAGQDRMVARDHLGRLELARRRLRANQEQ
jgi:hypothetical protein